MITDGGEVTFVRRMFAESILLKDRCRYADYSI